MLAVLSLAWSFWRDARNIARAKRRLDKESAAARERAILRAGGQRFRERAFHMGGLLIKVGQFLSARTDVLPIEFTRELQALQDQVPAAEFQEVRAVLEEAYGKPLSTIFSEFESVPLAAASLGQVHRARLLDSLDWVAVKVQRPGITTLAAIDLSALSIIMRVISRWTKLGRRINAVRLFEEFQTLVGQELDYLHEQENLREVSQNFASQASVRVPRVYPELTRTKVLVMELVEGVKLTEWDKLKDLDVDAKKLARTLVTAYLQQIIIDGLVQIDPHPGNFLADREGRLVLLDFGMCGRIPATQMPYAAKLIQGVLARDARILVQAMTGLGFIRPQADVRLLVRSMAVLLQQVGSVALKAGPQLDQAVTDFQDFIYEEPIEFPAEYMFLGRAIGMLFSLANQLDDNIDWLKLIQQEALPMINARGLNPSGWQAHLGQLIGGLFGSQAEVAARMVIERSVEEILRLGRLPSSLERVLNALEDDGLKTQPAWTPVLRRVDTLSQQVRLLVDTVFAAGVAVVWRLWPMGHGRGWWLAATLMATAIWIRAALSQFSARRQPSGRTSRNG